MSPAPILSRRGLLRAAAGTACLSACGKDERPPAPQYPNAFFVAHRGGGRDWPEMTVRAYTEAAKLPGLSGMEVSVRRTRDGVLVCSHDPRTGRLGTKDLVVAQSTWAELAGISIKPTETLDPSQPGDRLARLDEVIDAWPKGMPMWIEPKSDDAVDPVFRKLVNHPQLDVVWKRPVNALFDKARAQGWRTFGYVLGGDDQLALLRKAEPLKLIDVVGVDKSSDDPRVQLVAGIAGSYGRKAMMWALATVAERDRALRLGCDGLMCSDIKGLLAAPMPST